MTIKKNASKSSRYYYVNIAVTMRRGGTELRRFHTPVNPRALPASEQMVFIAMTLRHLGIKVEEVADLGSESAVLFAVWDTEAECKAAYDESVAFFDAKPGAGFSLLN